jgi:hypothetical protein
MTTSETIATGERADLLETLAKHPYLLRFTVRDLSDEQAAQQTDHRHRDRAARPGAWERGCKR